MEESPWSRSRSLVLCAGIVLGAPASGCGAAHALANPAVLQALEPAPLRVVLRRAELARAIGVRVSALTDQVPADEAIARASALSATNAEEDLNRAGKEAVYGRAPARVLPAEAWFRELSSSCTPGSEQGTLVSLLGAPVAAGYREVASQSAQLARMKAEAESLEDRADAKGLKESDKAALLAKAKSLKADIEKQEDAFDAKQERLFATIKQAARGTSAADKTRLRLAVANLVNAIKDARAANTMALGRYPLAAAELSNDIQEVPKGYVADIIEEQTGYRPDLSGFQPNVGFKDGRLQLGLNGIPLKAIGNIDPVALTEEAAKRSERYIEFVLLFTAYIAETEEQLEFEQGMFEAWADGLGSEPSGASKPVDISNLRVMSNQLKPVEESSPRQKIRSSISGLTVALCENGGPKPAPVVEGEPPPLPIGGVLPIDPGLGNALPVPGGGPLPLLPVTPGTQPADALASSQAEPKRSNTLGWVLGGVGVVGLGVGTTTLLVGLRQQDIGNANCSDQFHVCTPEGGAANQNARTLAVVSTVSYAVGAAALGTGVVLLVSGGSKQKKTAVLTRANAGGAEVVLKRTW